MNTPFRQRWERMPSLVRFIFILSILGGLAAGVEAGRLLTGEGYEASGSMSAWMIRAGAVMVLGALAYGIATEHRYPRLLSTIAFTVQPFARGEVSWQAAVASVIFLVVAVWLLYWNSDVTDYYIILNDTVRERKGATI